MVITKEGHPSTPFPRRVNIASDSLRHDVEIRFHRGAVISGVVADASGQAVSGAIITALRTQYVYGEQRPIPARGGPYLTIAGEFRIFGLPAGTYRVLATPPRTRVDRTRTDPSDGVNVPTYFPESESADEAQAVSVKADGAANIYISLRKAPVARISGVVLDWPGGAGLVTTRSASGTAASTSASIQPNGQFSINGLARGTYYLTARGAAIDATWAGRVVVGSGDIDGVLLQPMRKIVVAGVVRGVSRVPPEKAIQVTASFMGTGPVGGRTPPATPEQGFFTLDLWPGKYLIRITTRDPGWSLARVLLNGVDVTDSGFDVTAADSASQLTVEVADGVSQLTGVVSADLRDPSIVVFPQNRARLHAPSGRYISMVKPQPDGRFQTGPMPPGEYYVIALEDIDSLDWRDPDVLERLRGSQRVTLSPTAKAPVYLSAPAP
jgi:hypothetical protein